MIGILGTATLAARQVRHIQTLTSGNDFYGEVVKLTPDGKRLYSSWYDNAVYEIVVHDIQDGAAGSATAELNSSTGRFTYITASNSTGDGVTPTIGYIYLDGDSHSGFYRNGTIIPGGATNVALLAVSGNGNTGFMANTNSHETFYEGLTLADGHYEFFESAFNGVRFVDDYPEACKPIDSSVYGILQDLAMSNDGSIGVLCYSMQNKIWVSEIRFADTFSGEAWCLFDDAWGEAYDANSEYCKIGLNADGTLLTILYNEPIEVKMVDLVSKQEILYENVSGVTGPPCGARLAVSASNTDLSGYYAVADGLNSAVRIHSYGTATLAGDGCANNVCDLDVGGGTYAGADVSFSYDGTLLAVGSPDKPPQQFAQCETTKEARRNQGGNSEIYVFSISELTTPAPATPALATLAPESDSGLSGAAIGGIVGGAVGGIALVAVAIRAYQIWKPATGVMSSFCDRFWGSNYARV